MNGYEALGELLVGGGVQRAVAERPRVASAERPRVAVPLASHQEILGCIGHAIGRTAEFVLIGDEAEIRAVAARVGADVSRARFLAESDEARACALAARLVRDGEAELLMKGQVQTSTFTRAILDRDNGLVEPGRLVSHVTVCGIPRYHKPLLLTDAAINIEPSLEQKVEILRNALAVARALGISRPKVACIAPVEKQSARIRSTVDAAALVAVAADPRHGLGSLDIQGPLGLDLAISREAAEIKGISGPVVGDADILLMPALDSANVLYKSLTAFAGARMASVLAGARVPVVLTSRSDTEETKELSLALALRLAGASLHPSDALTITFRKEHTESTDYTDLQGQYLSYIYNYSVIHHRAPSEADFRDFFGTTPPTIHNMILKLEAKGLIGRVPGEPRSIRLLIPPQRLPILRPASPQRP